MNSVSGLNSKHMKERHENSEVRAGQPRLLDQVRDRIRTKHYSIRTEQTYVEEKGVLSPSDTLSS